MTVQINIKPIGLIILIVSVSLSLFSTGCGQSYEEREAKKAEERERIRKNEEKEKLAIDQLAKKHNAIYFPPKTLGVDSFIYEFQEFFKIHSKKPILFKGYLEDIEQTKNGIIVEFIDPLGSFYLNKKAIHFILTISESSVKPFLKLKRNEMAYSPLMRNLYGPDFIVIAKIENIMSSHKYVPETTNNENDIENTGLVRTFISTGQFVDAVAITPTKRDNTGDNIPTDGKKGSLPGVR